MTLEVSSAVLAGMTELAAGAHPRECCGILLGEGGRISAILAAANVHPQAETHFEIDPQALVDAYRTARHGGPGVIGYFHSHPNRLARPSRTDRAQATHDGSVWAIVAGDEVTFWRDVAEGFIPLSYRVSDS
ncbi:M67 family metallopeptidase [Parerythrobacter aurantius]|uniref:Mov34/MPN/PAD-1 family protein n=1 Tax=Parerythrobacter aurantius TaxID=3127706 RepID=UPI00324DCC68